MGWKAFKEKFAIHHSVQITGEGVCIGSAYVHDLAVIDPKTGRAAANRVFPDFLAKSYPALLAADPAEIVRMLETPDVFASSIVVYTYDGPRIVEKLCERTGWPNVAHDGCMMYDNTFSTDRNEVIGWARKDAASGASFVRDRIAELEKELADLRIRLAVHEADRAELDRLPETDAVAS